MTMKRNRQFASDNCSGICPEAWEAMAEANIGHEPSYGNDVWTQRATDRIREIFEKIVEINRERGLTILLVEQNANRALEISSFGYVLETGKITVQGDSASLRQNPRVQNAYLGGS